MDGEAIESGRSGAYILVEKSKPPGDHHVKDIRNSSIHGADRIPSRAEIRFYVSARMRYFRGEHGLTAQNLKEQDVRPSHAKT